MSEGSKDQKTSDSERGIKGLLQKIRQFPSLVTRDIWQVSSLTATGAKNKFYRILRIATLLVQGLLDKRVLQQAAALSYYSLIGLGPLVAIGIMISSFVLERSEDETDIATETLNRVILFISPPASEWSRLDGNNNGEVQTNEDLPAIMAEEQVVNPELVTLIENLISSARSGTVGLVGSLILIVIVIQLFTSIEQSFNSIWGVRRGRSMIERVVFYWTLISLGTVLGFASVIILSATAIARHIDRLQDGIPWVNWGILIGPVLSFILLTFLLASFNRFIPNTTVRWKPALIGAFVAALLLLANHYLSFLYVQRVITAQSLYGSVGIIPVLMIGLYVFWLIVLFGGQTTYAIQNADNMTRRSVWENISEHTREMLSFAALVLICRRFYECKEAYLIGELADALRVPARLLNNSLERLVDAGWLSPVETQDKHRNKDLRFQPGRPLDKMTLGGFKKMFEHFGNNTGAQVIYDIDPVVEHYKDVSDHLYRQDWQNKTIENLIEEKPAKKIPPGDE